MFSRNWCPLVKQCNLKWVDQLEAPILGETSVSTKLVPETLFQRIWYPNRATLVSPGNRKPNAFFLVTGTLFFFVRVSCHFWFCGKY